MSLHLCIFKMFKESKNYVHIDIPGCQELRTRELMTLATSGLTGEGVEEGIEWVADTALRNSATRPPHEATR